MKEALKVKRIEELKKTTHIFYSDAGHAWLAVNKDDLKILEIDKSITPYSFVNGEKVFLEEDLDASIYIQTLFGIELTDPEWLHFKNNHIKEEYLGDHCMIRNYNRYII